jgi:epoxyqueuosine reductase QueG
MSIFSRNIDAAEENQQALTTLCKSLGFTDVGYVPLKQISEALHPSLREIITSKITGAIAFVFHLSDAIMDSIVDHPTALYSFHYNRVNHWIDTKILDVMTEIQNAGVAALPIPASQVVDRGSQRGHVMHKIVALEAGLGWIGRNNLLVTKKHGARVRLGTLLTGLPLVPSKKLPFSCGTCSNCVATCPAKAIGESPEEFRLDLCDMQIRSFKQRMFVTQGICGICQTACGEPQMES